LHDPLGLVWVEALLFFEIIIVVTRNIVAILVLASLRTRSCSVLARLRLLVPGHASSDLLDDWIVFERRPLKHAHLFVEVNQVGLVKPVLGEFAQLLRGFSF
jgi:hypothetical protein